MTEPELSPEDERRKAEQVLAQYELELTDLNEKLKPGEEESQIESALFDIERQMTELRRQAEMLKQQREAYKQTKFDIRRQIRIIGYERDDAQRQLDLAIENEQKLAQLLARIEYFDSITQDKPWRKTLYKHQLDGAHFCANAGRALCADGMGLGTTRLGIADMDMLEAKKILIVCPGDVQRGWEREMNEFAPHRAAVIIGKMPYSEQKVWLEMFANEDEYTFIINYESWARNNRIIQDLIAMQFDMVIIDEAHETKTADSVTFRGLRELVYAKNNCPVENCTSYMLDGMRICSNNHIMNELDITGQNQPVASVKNMLVMTGTPILNNPLEIFTLLNLINRELFPSQAAFIRDFCDRNVYSGKIVWKPGGDSRLANKIKSFYIRRELKDTGIELPPQEIIVHSIEFDAELYPLQAEVLEQLRKRAQLMMSNGKASKPMQILELITRQRQATVWPGGIKLREPVIGWDGYPMLDEKGNQVTEIVNFGDDYRESIKLDKAEELIAELNANGHRVIIFSLFSKVIEEMQRRLGETACSFYGGTSQEQRELIRRNFDPVYGEEPKWKNCIANFQVGGVGINLTEATAIVILDEAWNPGINNQAYDRIHRIGQKNKTQVHIMRVENSMDDWMAGLIEQKRNILNSFDAANVDQGDLYEMLKHAFDAPTGDLQPPVFDNPDTDKEDDDNGDE